MSTGRVVPTWLAVMALVLAGVAFGIGATRLLDGARRDRLAESQAELERVVEHGLTRHRVLQLELAYAAQQLARSPLTTRLGLVIDFADRLTGLAARAERAVPGSPDDPAVARLREAHIAPDDEVVLAFARAYTTRLAQHHDAPPLALATEARALLVGCLPGGLERCLHHAAREPLTAFAEAVRRAPKSLAVSLGPEVLLAVDAQGIGRADADVAAWTGVGVTAALPIVAEALTSRTVVRDVGPIPGRDGLHLMVAAPLLEGDALRGVALVAVVLGGHQLAADAAAVGYDLTWTIAGALGVASSTLSADDQAALDGERFLIARAAVPGNVSQTPTLIASIRKDLVESGLAATRARLWWASLGIAALLSLALVVFRRRVAPRPAPGTPPTVRGSSDPSPPPAAG